MSLQEKVHIAFMTTAAGGFFIALLASDSDAGRVFAFAVLGIGGIVGRTMMARSPHGDDT